MYADTVSELLSAVIPGYDELPSNENGDEAAFVARYEAAIELANLVQTGLVIDATENDGWSPEQVTEDELNALFQSKVVPFVPCEGADGTVSAEWRVDVPLVVIDTDYAGCAAVMIANSGGTRAAQMTRSTRLTTMVRSRSRRSSPSTARRPGAGGRAHVRRRSPGM
jgi:hypothetical protein